MDESSLPGVGAEEIERARAPLERAWALPPAAYVRPDIYDLEVERILRRSWAPLARTEQAPEPGDYIAMDFMGQPVLLVHGLTGQRRVRRVIDRRVRATGAIECSHSHRASPPST